MEGRLEKVNKELSTSTYIASVEKFLLFPLNFPSPSLQPLKRCLGHSSGNSLHFLTKSLSDRQSHLIMAE